MTLWLKPDKMKSFLIGCLGLFAAACFWVAGTVINAVQKIEDINQWIKYKWEVTMFSDTRKYGPVIAICIFVLLVLCLACRVGAATVTLAWDSHPYQTYVYHKTTGEYSFPHPVALAEIGNSSIIIDNLVPGETYFFVVTAYDGMESGPSNEVSYIVPVSSIKVVVPLPAILAESHVLTLSIQPVGK